MNDIGIRSAKVRAGYYRVGSFCIHKGNRGWAVYDRNKVVTITRTLSVAYHRAKRMANDREATGSQS